MTLTDNEPGHPEALMEMDNEIHVVLMSPNTVSSPAAQGSGSHVDFQILLWEK